MTVHASLRGLRNTLGEGVRGDCDDGAALLPQLIDEVTQVHQAIKSAF